MARVSCGLDYFLRAVRDRLVSRGVVKDAQTFLTLDADDMLIGTQAPPVIGVSFDAFDQRPDTLHSEQFEHDAPVMEGELTVALWTRVALDTPGQDARAITNATLGAAQMMRLIFDALNNVELYKDGDIITWRSLTFIGVRNRGRWAKDKNWRRADVRFDAAFVWRPTGLTPITIGGVGLSDPINDLILEPG